MPIEIVVHVVLGWLFWPICLLVHWRNRVRAFCLLQSGKAKTISVINEMKRNANLSTDINGIDCVLLYVIHTLQREIRLVNLSPISVVKNGIWHLMSTSFGVWKTACIHYESVPGSHSSPVTTTTLRVIYVTCISLSIYFN
jgi:hypothetical protein